MLSIFYSSLRIMKNLLKLSNYWKGNTMEKEYEVMPMSLEQIKEIEQRLADIVRAYEEEKRNAS